MYQNAFPYNFSLGLAKPSFEIAFKIMVFCAFIRKTEILAVNVCQFEARASIKNENSNNIIRHKILIAISHNFLCKIATRRDLC